jgi:hypothetical protein
MPSFEDFDVTLSVNSQLLTVDSNSERILFSPINAGMSLKTNDHY